MSYESMGYKWLTTRTFSCSLQATSSLAKSPIPF